MGIRYRFGVVSLGMPTRSGLGVKGCRGQFGSVRQPMDNRARNHVKYNKSDGKHRTLII